MPAPAAPCERQALCAASPPSLPFWCVSTRLSAQLGFLQGPLLCSEAATEAGLYLGSFRGGEQECDSRVRGRDALSPLTAHSKFIVPC